MTGISFLKMHGLGNDFVVLDGRAQKVQVDSAFAKRVADRRTGIGCDQLVLLENSSTADVRMRIFNADGSEVETCGNATRCVAWLVHTQSRATAVTIETGAGVLTAQITGDYRVQVDMGAPKLQWKEIPLSKEEDTLHLNIVDGDLRDVVAVSMGNPHAVFFVDNVEAAPVEIIGRRIENHSLFPKRTNVEFAQVTARDRIVLRVWERGAGETQACGSGACATLVAAVRRGLADRKAAVTLPGGDLEIEWLPDAQGGHVLMTGPVAISFSGTVECP